MFWNRPRPFTQKQDKNTGEIAICDSDNSNVSSIIGDEIDIFLSANDVRKGFRFMFIGFYGFKLMIKLRENLGIAEIAS